jgi:hypothetical protein
MITESDVRAAYRLILGREPESEAVLSLIAQRGYSLKELGRAFLNSPEFLESPVGPARRQMPLDWSPLTIETDGSASDIALMLRRIESYWRQIASDEVHAPLVQSGNPNTSAFTEGELLFYADGEKYMQDFRFTAERCGISLADHKVCLELGAGVGRGTRWLAGQRKAGTFHRISRASLAAAATLWLKPAASICTTRAHRNSRRQSLSGALAFCEHDSCGGFRCGGANQSSDLRPDWAMRRSPRGEAQSLYY